VVEDGFKKLEANGFMKFLPIAPVKKETLRLTPLEKSLAKIKSFYSCDGFWIYVGGNAVENETVSFRVGSGKDAWMHVANVPGSHVVVKLNNKGDEIPHTTLLEAALLAVHFSKYRDRPNVQVSVTTVNHVKKAKGAPVGTVHAHFTKPLKVSDNKEQLQKIIERTNQKKQE
jgi:predicted ribosome quality control (RQC) complex YloA/Tae2 family protein